MLSKNTIRFSPDPANPFSNRLIQKPLPRIHLPALAMFYVGQNKFMLLFGGRKQLGHKLTSDLIAVNLQELTWFIVSVEGASVIPRMSPSMITVGNCAYI